MISVQSTEAMRWELSMETGDHWINENGIDLDTMEANNDDMSIQSQEAVPVLIDTKKDICGQEYEAERMEEVTNETDKNCHCCRYLIL